MVLFIWLFLEAIFWIYLRQTWIRLQRHLKPDTLPSDEERYRLYWNCVHTVTDDFEGWLTGWFLYTTGNDGQPEHPNFEEIQRENVALWLSWAFWCDSTENVRMVDTFAAELEWMIHTIEVMFKVKFPKGYNPHIRCIRPTLDSFSYVHRPLIAYAFNYLMTGTFNLLFLEMFAGYRRYGSNRPGIRWGMLFHLFSSPPLRTTHSQTVKHSLGSTDDTQHYHLAYWYRKGKAASTTPILFIHGIGTGLNVYAEFIHRITALDRPVFCIELPHVSSRLVEHVPTPQEIVSEIQVMLNTHGFDKAVVVAHSLGTAVASWIGNLAPDLVAGLVLIDPICFLLHHHYVAYNMLYRVPKRPAEYFIHYFASRELYISYYINRHFHWYQTAFFVVDETNTSSKPPILPNQKRDLKSPFHNSAVYLSEKDAIVNTHLITHYLIRQSVDTTVMTQLAHAEFLVRSEWRKRIMLDIENIVIKTEEKDEAVVFLDGKL
ncbi:Alpha/Beta hydrolase protein [Zychaea mexicana]|uniref:Alpha/Beta hydrolase protein n=1 Tax=Zychaea mexicana TaxID=64656 RepID=UPI0022FEBC89|nr:Alpha/Beta hydrolase protein [Zychaea mexicana]KAI9476615.1 Alpha/Beta hydrolase protein [Zychaea mexicana]